MPQTKEMSKGTASITGSAVRLGKIFALSLIEAGYDGKPWGHTWKAIQGIPVRQQGETEVSPWFLLQAWPATVCWNIEYSLSNSGDSRSGENGCKTRSSYIGTEIQRSSGNMDNNSRGNTGSDIGHCGIGIQARGNTLLRWPMDNCKDNHLSFLQFQFQLFQRSLAYGFYYTAQDPEIRRFLR